MSRKVSHSSRVYQHKYFLDTTLNITTVAPTSEVRTAVKLLLDVFVSPMWGQISSFLLRTQQPLFLSCSLHSSFLHFSTNLF